MNPQWVSREAAVSDDVAREFLVGRIQNDLHEVVKELEGVVNIIERARKLINGLPEGILKPPRVDNNER